MKKNIEVINIQTFLLKKKLVENKKKSKSFFKIAIISFFLIAITSLVIGISTNKDSQKFSSMQQHTKPWLSESYYG
jgi:uncharacterized membrane protein YvlD (DUF360 family)|tara:strand:+ start:720 stop:947 length:228 start_codon:yes stop_codon:yes gene_type:complete